MGNLKIALIAIALTACAAPNPQHVPAQGDPVAKDLIPPGFTQAECHYESPATTQESNSGGFSGSSANAAAHADTGGASHRRPFKCKHEVGVPR
jgi:hypothetical protein